MGLALSPGLEGGQLAADGTPQDPNRDSSWKFNGSWAHAGGGLFSLLSGPTVALIVSTSDRGDFWALPVEILVFANPTGYMLTFSGFPLLNWRIFYRFLKMMGNFPAVSNFNRLFLKLHRFIYN